MTRWQVGLLVLGIIVFVEGIFVGGLALAARADQARLPDAASAERLDLGDEVPFEVWALRLPTIHRTCYAIRNPSGMSKGTTVLECPR